MAKKPLWDFIEKRMHELGLTRYDLEMDYDIPYATMQRAKAGFTNFKEVTKQKMALALKCTIGDINAAISGETPALPAHEMELLAKNEAVPSIMETVDRLEQMVKEDHPYLAEPSKKQKQEKARDASKEQTEKKEPERAPLRVVRNDGPKEKWPEDPPEAQKDPSPDCLDAMLYATAAQNHDLFGIKKARQDAVAEYKQKLKDIALQALVKVPILNVSGETPIGLAGRALMDELLKDDTEAK